MKKSESIILKTANIALCILCLFSVSCSNSRKNSARKIETKELIEEDSRPKWQPSEKKICIVFGYGYNSEQFVKKELECLEFNFGLSDGTENSGLILPYVFPDDFTVGSTGRISKLTSLLEDVKLAGIITLGAPEYTNNTLAAFRETMEEGSEFPIYTLFPQDDILAIEATSDFVLDKAVEQSENIQDMQAEAEQIVVSGIEDIIENAVDYMIQFPKPLENDVNLRMHVSKIAGTKYNIKRYVDPETGLSSINHFIIESKKAAAHE